MNMETANFSPTECLEKFTVISKEKPELSEISSDNRVIVSMENKDDDDDAKGSNYYNDVNNYNNNNDDDDAHTNTYDEYRKKRQAQCDSCMICISPLFASQPQVEKVCKDWENEFLSSGFTKYTFSINRNDSVNELHKKGNDLEHLINLGGINLTCLNVEQYPTSQMIPIINANCPNLEELSLGFQEIMSQDFENCFSNMSHLKDLTIEWQCENSTLPMTLAKSLEQIGGTLKSLELSCTLEENNIFSPDSLASVFPRLIALNCLEITGFGLSQLLLQSIGEMKNLVDLTLASPWPNNHPMLHPRINIYSIGNLKDLEKLHIECYYGVEDEFLINLCNNAKKLRYLYIIGTNITDTGMSAIDNLEQLEDFDLGLAYRGLPLKKNEFITDESIQRLFNQKLHTLDISNCMKITDKGVIQLAKNLLNLDTLFIRNTKVTWEAVREISELSIYRKKRLGVYKTFEIGN